MAPDGSTEQIKFQTNMNDSNGEQERAAESSAHVRFAPDVRAVGQDDDQMKIINGAHLTQASGASSSFFDESSSDDQPGELPSTGAVDEHEDVTTASEKLPFPFFVSGGASILSSVPCLSASSASSAIIKLQNSKVASRHDSISSSTSSMPKSACSSPKIRHHNSDEDLWSRHKDHPSKNKGLAKSTSTASFLRDYEPSFAATDIPTCLPKHKLGVLSVNYHDQGRWKVLLNDVMTLSKKDVLKLLQNGAISYGFWKLPVVTLKPLATDLERQKQLQDLGELNHVVSDSSSDTFALTNKASSIETSKMLLRSGSQRLTQNLDDLVLKGSRDANSRFSTNLEQLSLGVPSQRSWLRRVMAAEGVPVCIVLHILISAVSASYGFWNLPEQDSFSDYVGALFIAKKTALASVCWICVSLVMMCRRLLTYLSDGVCGSSFFINVYVSHKVIHMHAAIAMSVHATLHGICHVFFVVPGLAQLEVHEFNDLVKCTPQNHHKYVFFSDGAPFQKVAFPACPATGTENLLTWYLSWPYVTGILMCVLLGIVVKYSSPWWRKHRYNTFYYVHIVAVILFPILLVLHGFNQWFGLGMPMALYTIFPFFLLYAIGERAAKGRWAKAKLVYAVCQKGASGQAMLWFRLPYGKSALPGQYGMFCIPKLGKMEWHPYTFALTGQMDMYGDTMVAIIVQGVGDWSKSVVEAVVDSPDLREIGPELEDQILWRQPWLKSLHLRKPDLDVFCFGPLAAPSQHLNSARVVLAFGAGVGFTPFLGQLSFLLTAVEKDLKEGKTPRLKKAHFFWMTRRPEDFLFGLAYVKQIACSSILSEIFQLHLHVTAQPDESRRDVSPLVFRHCIHTMSEDARNILIANGKELPLFWSCDSPLDAIYVHDLGAETRFAIAFGRPDIQHCFHRVATEYPDEDLSAYVCGGGPLIDDVGKHVQGINSQKSRQKCTFAWEKFG